MIPAAALDRSDAAANRQGPRQLFDTKQQAVFLGVNKKIAKIMEMISLVADTDATVLIQGESGTGKELITRSIHSLSSRRGSPFIAVNCSALAKSLLESEMFGYARGAFTGADSSKIGKIEAARRDAVPRRAGRWGDRSRWSSSGSSRPASSCGSGRRKPSSATPG